MSSITINYFWMESERSGGSRAMEIAEFVSSFWGVVIGRHGKGGSAKGHHDVSVFNMEVVRETDASLRHKLVRTCNWVVTFICVSSFLFILISAVFRPDVSV